MKKKISTIAAISVFAIIIVFCIISVLTQKNTEIKEQANFNHIKEIVTEEATIAIQKPIIFNMEVADEKGNEEVLLKKSSKELSQNQTEIITYQTHSVSDLFSMNADCFGWLSIAGTSINYPVMHTSNNPQKYLHKNFYGEYSQSGVPFLDSRCNLDSTNLIVYGHNMNNETMFADLCNYTDFSYFTQHSTVVLETNRGVSTYTVFAVMKAKSDDDWYSFITADTEQEYDSKIKYAKEHSLYDIGITPEYNKQILTLSTCYGGNRDNRILVLAVEN